MNIRSFRIGPVTVSVIMALLTGCGTTGNTASSARAVRSRTDDTRVLVTRANSSIVTVAGLTGKTIAVNATNSIGTLLTSVLLCDHGIVPGRVRFVTDQRGFPAMPASLQSGVWGAAFLAEPYLTFAGEKYGDRSWPTWIRARP